jgi:hypothetical protein
MPEDHMNTEGFFLYNHLPLQHRSKSGMPEPVVICRPTIYTKQFSLQYLRSTEASYFVCLPFGGNVNKLLILIDADGRIIAAYSLVVAK